MPTPGGPTSVMIAPLPRAVDRLVDATLVRAACGWRGTRRCGPSRRRARSGRRRGRGGRRRDRACRRCASPHGSSNMRSSQVRIQACSGDWLLVRSNRSSSFAIASFTPSGASSVVELASRNSPTTSSSPSPSSLRIACELLAQQVLALLLVDALADVVADRLGHLQLGEVAPGPREDGTRRARRRRRASSTSRRRSGSNSAQVATASASAPGCEAGAEELGEAARPAQLGDQLQRARQLTAERLDARRRARVGEHLDVGVIGAALAGVHGARCGHDPRSARPRRGRRSAACRWTGTRATTATRASRRRRQQSATASARARRSARRRRRRRPGGVARRRGRA